MADQNSNSAPGIKLPRISERLKQQVKFHFLKSNFFRVIHADGIWGGVAGRGDIHISFFSERPPIPKTSTVEIQPDGTIKELPPESKTGIIREIEVDVVMNLETAKAFHVWLAEKIAVSEELERSIAAGTVTLAHSPATKTETAL